MTPQPACGRRTAPAMQNRKVWPIQRPAAPATHHQAYGGVEAVNGGGDSGSRKVGRTREPQSPGEGFCRFCIASAGYGVGSWIAASGMLMFGGLQPQQLSKPLLDASSPWNCAGDIEAAGAALLSAARIVSKERALSARSRASLPQPKRGRSWSTVTPTMRRLP